MFSIRKIDGNSKIGTPVFSVQGMRDNFKYMAFQMSYDEAKDLAERNKQESELQLQIKMYKGFQ